MRYAKHFIPLESNPDIFNELARVLGAPSNLSFDDIFTLDEPDFLPHPTLAVILIFPAGEGYEERIATKEAESGEDGIPDASDNVVWFKQTIHNACGLYAILHALSSCEARTMIEPDSILDGLLKQYASMAHVSRPSVLEHSTDLEAAYAAVASKGDTQAPSNAEDEVDFHYVCFTRSSNGYIYELDGDLDGPKNTYVLVPKGEDLLGPSALNAVRSFIVANGGDGDLHFSMMALVRHDAGL